LNIKGISSRKVMSFSRLAISIVSFGDSTTQGPAIKKSFLVLPKLYDLPPLFIFISVINNQVFKAKLKNIDYYNNLNPRPQLVFYTNFSLRRGIVFANIVH
jgi:hypothetical protein